MQISGTKYYNARLERLNVLYEIETGMCGVVSRAMNTVQMALDGHVPASVQYFKVLLKCSYACGGE